MGLVMPFSVRPHDRHILPRDSTFRHSFLCPTGFTQRAPQRGHPHPLLSLSRTSHFRAIVRTLSGGSGVQKYHRLLSDLSASSSESVPLNRATLVSLLTPYMFDIHRHVQYTRDSRLWVPCESDAPIGSYESFLSHIRAWQSGALAWRL